MSSERKRRVRSVAEFRGEVDRWMKDLYGIDWQDACGEAEPLLRALKDGETPEEFVRWWGEKYDLIPLEEFEFGGAGARAPRGRRA